MTQEEEENYINRKFVDFVKKNESDKVTERQNILNPFTFHEFINFVCHMFSKNLVDMKNDKVKFDIIRNTNEQYISVTYGCIRFIDSYRFSSMRSDPFFKNLNEDDFKILKKKFH